MIVRLAVTLDPSQRVDSENRQVIHDFLRLFSKISAFLLAMDENLATRDSPNTISKRRGKYCVAFGCNNSYYCRWPSYKLSFLHLS